MTPTTSWAPANPPPSSQGRGDSAWSSWYQLALQEAESRVSEPQGPPFPVASAQVRQEAIGQIYGRVDRKDPPEHNVLSRALRAYYSRVELPTLKTLACQALCMITEYHFTCITRGSTVTSPILPAEIEERLPSIGDYAPPDDHMGVTDVRVWDNWARTLHVAVCLDMSVGDQESANSLVRSHHQQGDLLAYFLGLGMAWQLMFEDVVTQVLRENCRHLDVRRSKVITSLHSCNQRHITLQQEIDVTTDARDVSPNSPEGQGSRDGCSTDHSQNHSRRRREVYHGVRDHPYGLSDDGGGGPPGGGHP